MRLRVLKVSEPSALSNGAPRQSGEACDDGDEFGRVRRLRHVYVEAREQRAHAVFFARVGRERAACRERVYWTRTPTACSSLFSSANARRYSTKFLLPCSTTQRRCAGAASVSP